MSQFPEENPMTSPTKEAGMSQFPEKDSVTASKPREWTHQVEKLSEVTTPATPQQGNKEESLPVFLPERVDLRIFPGWFQKEHLLDPVVCDIPAWQVDKIFGPEGKDIPSIEQSTMTVLQVQILDPKGHASIFIYGAQDKKQLVQANIYCHRRWHELEAYREKLVKTFKIVRSAYQTKTPRQQHPSNGDCSMTRGWLG